MAMLLLGSKFEASVKQIREQRDGLWKEGEAPLMKARGSVPEEAWRFWGCGVGIESIPELSEAPWSGGTFSIQSVLLPKVRRSFQYFLP